MTEAHLHSALTIGLGVLSVIIAPLLLCISAPYGRHDRGGFGPRIDATLGWVAMEAPAALTLPLCFLLGDKGRGAAPLMFLLLWSVHYVNRAFIFPFRARRPGRRMALLVVASGLFFNVINGYLNGRWLFTLSPAHPPDWLVDPRFLCGGALFVAGLVVNLHSDAILLRLRAPGEAGYRIPRGGLFRLVSCPNYLGEIIEWFGWALMTFSLPGLVFAVWTAANLVPRALSHHRFYRERFPDYPRARRAILPYLV